MKASSILSNILRAWIVLVGFIFFFLQSSIPVLQAEESGSVTLWITSDIEGYLVGCDCPSGASAGLSAVTAVLESRRLDSELLFDAGGFREPRRSDPLLEGFMDEASVFLGYSGMVAVSSDLRDGRQAFNKRSRAVPIRASGGFEDSRFLRQIRGEDDALVLHHEKADIAVARWAGAGESELIELVSEGKLSSRSSSDILEILGSGEADYRILAISGNLEDWDSFVQGISGKNSAALKKLDLVIFTGPDSPASLLPTEGMSGGLSVQGVTIPWMSLAPRGNGLARLAINGDEKPELEIISLERGISPEALQILAMGDSYMEQLIARVSSGNKNGKKNKKPTVLSSERGESDYKPVYWYPYGCKSCEDFLWNTVPRLERQTGRTLLITEKDSGNPEDFDELLKLMNENGIELENIPVLLVDGVLLQGDEEIKEGLDNIMRGGSGSPNHGSRDSSPRWEPGAIILAGLLDGVNPCAFSAMVFLVSALAMAGRSKKTMLAIGMFYALGIFITYSLIGAGLLGGLRRVAVNSGLKYILEYILSGFLLLLSLLSILDGVKISKGRSDLILKLPEKLSKRVHKLIRDEVRSGAAAGGAFLLGAVVAIIELGCTGQVYLPTIAWMISRGEGATPWLWLLLYNSAFIIPLFIVFAVSYKGVSAVRLAAVFRKRGAALKFFTAGLLALLAVVLIIT